MDEKELQTELQKAREERAQKCLDEIKVILEKYHCQIVTSPLVHVNGQPVVAQVVSQ
jgi:hypothetical protein